MELKPEVFTADYTGEPGARTFYLQTQTTGAIHSFLLEKEQVAALAEKLRELLVMIDQQDTIRAAAPARDPALALQQPAEPEWRVGTIGLAYDEDDDHIVVFVQPVGPDEEDATTFDPEAGVRVALRRDQARAFVLHAMAVVGEGRAICQLCGLPMDPSGHQCPASNGHRPMS